MESQRRQIVGRLTLVRRVMRDQQSVILFVDDKAGIARVAAAGQLQHVLNL